MPSSNNSKPTNADLMRLVKEVKVDIRNIGDEINELKGRITPLEQWKIAVDAATAAIDKYKQDSMVPPGRMGVSAAQKDLINIIIKLIGVVTTTLGIVYFVVQDKL